MSAPDIYQSEPVRFPAPYAALSEHSRGRVYPIPRNPYRTDYQRDRDRIIHSTAFRRLQHKTQVFPNVGDENEKDHYRTRLTHTIEVAQISRTIARMLGINEDLAEAVALAHDLGHTPFGHAGEEVLDKLMADQGGFNHNQQSLRVVDYLEKRYPGKFGLNLTYELREAIIKHETDQELDIPEEFNNREQPLLEGQIVNFADEIAYYGHDVDDGLSSGLLTLEQLQALPILTDSISAIKKSLLTTSIDMIRYALIRHLVNRMVLDLGDEIKRRLEKQNIQTVEDIRAAQAGLAGFSTDQTEFNRELKSFLLKNMYRHEGLNRMKEKAAEIITTLFLHYHAHTGAIPEDFRRRYPEQEPSRVIIDYIAGMTDRFAFNEYTNLK
jgi:dGTPase